MCNERLQQPLQLSGLQQCAQPARFHGWQTPLLVLPTCPSDRRRFNDGSRPQGNTHFSYQHNQSEAMQRFAYVSIAHSHAHNPNSKMTRADSVMTEQRQSEVEQLARTMLSQSSSITPYSLADRAQINWFLARDILRGLAKKGHVRVLPSGRFGRRA